MFKKIFFSVLSTVCLLIVTITVAYAWYITKVADDFKSPLITGKSTAAYYAGGDGSKAKPYKIANERHLYNLAWLQYLGTYNKDYDEDGVVDQYYFEVINDIDCNDLVLPPIGTIDNPFLGNFDGNGYVIKNLSITNDYDNLVKKPSSINAESKFKGVEIIGFFGVIGKYAGFVDANISSEVNSAYDFNLDDLIIQNSSTNTLAGLVAGFVNANVSNVGVHYGKIELESGTKNISTFKNISGYTLIGDYDSELVSWEDKPGHSNTSGDLGYGTSTDLKKLYDTLIKNGHYITKDDGEKVASVSANFALPFKPTNQNIITDTGSTNNIEVKDGLFKTVENASYQKAHATNNIGYYVGDSIEIHKDDSALNYYENFYYPNGDGNPYELPSTISNKLHEAPTDEIQTYLKENGNYVLNLCSSSQFYPDQENDYYYVAEGNVGTYQGPLLLPRQSVWVAPIQPGTLKFVFTNISDGKRGFAIAKLRRAKPKDYSTYFSHVDSKYLSNNAQIYVQKSYYFEIEVTQEDIDAGYEYAVNTGDGYNPYISYIDLGAEGGQSAPSVDPDLKATAIEGVDFVYLNRNTDEFSSTVDDYSAVFFQISGTTNGLTEFYFRRNNDNEDNYAGSEGIVLYFAKNENESSWTTTSSGRTDGSSSLDWSYAGTKGEAGDSGDYTAEDCEVLANSKSSGGLANTNTGASTTFTITYNYINENDEVVYITKGKVTKGYAITTPTFEVDGYRLIKWYTDEALNTEYDFSKAVDSNIILYASSEVVQTHIVTFKDGDTILATDVVNNGSYATITTPTKLGYVFSHWEDANGNEVDLETTQITADLTLKAVWEDAYDITFAYNIGDDDVVIKIIQVKQGSKVSRPEEPELPGYKFVNWYTDKTYNSTFNYENAPTGNITIYAKFDEIPHYTVTYGYMENSELVTIMVDSVEENATPTKPDNPTREGYVFMGWFADETFENEFDFSEEITANTVVYAYWQKGITITFQYEDGSVIETMSIMSNNTVTPTAIVPAKDGYRFDGNWYLFVDGVASNEAFDFETKLLDDTILVPGWIKTYDVTFETNGGSSVDSQQVVINGVVTKPTDPTKSGYVFEGWYSDSNLAYEYNFSTQVTSDITLYAKWTEIVPSSVTFDVDGETTILTTDANGYVSFPANPSKENYIFLGWYVGETKVDSNTKFLEDTTVVAKWQEIFTITFVYDNGTDETVELTTNSEGKIDSLPIDPTYDGHRFLGWTYNSQTVTTSTVFAENATVTAEWIEVYTVTFNSNGGSEVSSQTVDNGSYAVEPTNPTKTGYRFLGWFTDETCNNAYNFSTAVTGNITLYAGWEEAQGYTITFNANEGELGNGSSEFEYTTSDTGMIPYSDFPTNPTREGYVFAGWYNNDKMYTSLDIFTDDITLNAKWHQTNKSVQLKYGYWTGGWGSSFIEFEVAGLPTTIALNNSNSMMSAPTIIEVDGYTYQTMQRQYGDSITETDYIWSQVVYVTYEPTS